jgi:hypothetical protein
MNREHKPSPTREPGNRKRGWTRQEDDFLRANHRRMDVEELYTALRRHTPQAVRGRLDKLGLRGGARRKGVTESELRRVRELYPVYGTRGTVRLTGLSINRLKNILRRYLPDVRYKGRGKDKDNTQYQSPNTNTQTD